MVLLRQYDQKVLGSALSRFDSPFTTIAQADIELRYSFVIPLKPLLCWSIGCDKSA